MEQITDIKCIELLKDKFPNFIPYWESAIGKDFELDDSLFIKFMPFENYVVDIIKINNKTEIRKIFYFIEILLCDGNEDVQTVITTGFLEYLINIAPEEIQFDKFVQYIGKKAIEYCRAWDKFNGVRTEGLW